MNDVYDLMGPAINTRHIDMNVIKQGGNIGDASYWPMMGQESPGAPIHQPKAQPTYAAMEKRSQVASASPDYQRQMESLVEKAYSKMSPAQLLEFQNFSRMIPGVDEPTALIMFLDRKDQERGTREAGQFRYHDENRYRKAIDANSKMQDSDVDPYDIIIEGNQ